MAFSFFIQDSFSFLLLLDILFLLLHIKLLYIIVFLSLELFLFFQVLLFCFNYLQLVDDHPKFAIVSGDWNFSFVFVQVFVWAGVAFLGTFVSKALKENVFVFAFIKSLACDHAINVVFEAIDHILSLF